MMRVEVLTVPDCPNGLVARRHLAEVVAGQPGVRVENRVVSTPEDAVRYGMHGSPTILIDGRDPFAEAGATASLSCRLYRDGDGRGQGAPSVGQLREALAAAAACVGQERPWDRQAVHDELDRVQADFRQLLAQATPASLARRSDGTRWTNEQLLFHMLFGYLIVRALLPLTAFFGRLPSSASRGYARLLNATTKPFDLVNYLGPCVAVHIYGHRRMAAKLGRVMTALHRRIDAATPDDLARGMHYPARWDPFFTGYMTLADLFRYPTKHYDFHRRQLTLSTERPPSARPESGPPS